jgi:hypothetical protein
MEQNPIQRNDTVRKYLIGILIGVALTISTSVFAEDIQTLIGVKVQGEFPVKLNGEQLVKPAIVINGTSYLPNRTIADALGMDITFDADLGIELKSKEEVSMNSLVTPTENTPLSTETIASRTNDLYVVNSQIRLKNQAISFTKLNIEKTPDDPNVVEWKNQVVKFKEDLTIWEARKATLETNPTPTP